MSDGALSQDEIDALLAGVDSSSLGMPTPSSGGGVSDQSKALLQEYLASTVQTQSSNLSMMTGTNVIMQLAQVDGVNRESFLQKVPDMVVAVKVDFTSGFPGEHLFVLSEEGAKKIASLMNKEENIELDDMALSVISEIISQLTGTQITALSEKTGNKSIASMSPEATYVPKAVVALPNGDFARATYQLSLGDGTTLPIWEVYAATVVQDIASALSGGSIPKPSSPQSMAGIGSSAMDGFGANPAMGGMGMPGMQAQQPMGGMAMGGAPMGGVAGYPPMGQNPAGFGSYGMGGPATNVWPRNQCTTGPIPQSDAPTFIHRTGKYRSHHGCLHGDDRRARQN